MTISFDLDDTLIPGVKRFDTISGSVLHKIFGLETFRVGTVELIKKLQSEGHEIFVYATSFRSITKIWWTFSVSGVRLDKIINQRTHNKILKEESKRCSKYPPAFGIDVHIDDSKGVEMEGERYGFKTIIVAENNFAWTDFVLAEIASIQKS